MRVFGPRGGAAVSGVAGFGEGSVSVRRYWTLDDIAWERFASDRVDPDILKIIKGASLVEYNAADYGRYLGNVFHDDPLFIADSRSWVEEEVQHGEALARWAAMADPDFDFAASLKCFRDGFRVPMDAAESIRGSRVGELVARCIVETGTSSYYTVLGDTTDEPVLKDICRRIAADEIRHYKLFRAHMARYLEAEKLGRWRRLGVALGRLGESDDDELAYAYYAANNRTLPYDRTRDSAAALGRALGYYRPKHVDMAVKLVLKAAGFQPGAGLRRLISRLAYRFLRRRVRRLRRVAAA